MLLYILIFLTLCSEVLKRSPRLVESLYSSGFYPWVSKGIHQFTSWFPFSIGELLFYMSVLALLVSFAVFIYCIIKKDLKARHYKQLSHYVANVILIGLLLFNSVWGFNYHRLPLTYHLDIQVRKHTDKELIRLCNTLVQQANTLAEKVHKDSQLTTEIPGGYLYVFENAHMGFASLGEDYPLFETSYSKPKPVLSSWVMSYSGISGIYSPFTAEANVNVDIEDVMLPATTLHEMAHLYGVAKEDEANFIAYLSSQYHPDPVFQYSGTMLALIHSVNALHGQNTDAYLDVRSKYSDRVSQDLNAIRTFWHGYEGPIDDVQDKMNDQYLKANGQDDGVDSYGKMVDLLLELNQIEHLKTAQKTAQ